MSSKEKVYGEGNYEASRRYYAGVKKFVDSGRVDGAAREAAPKTPADAVEMKQAEEAALLRAKGKKKQTPIEEPDAPRPSIDDSDRGPEETRGGTPPRPGRGADRR